MRDASVTRNRSTSQHRRRHHHQQQQYLLSVISYVIITISKMAAVHAQLSSGSSLSCKNEGEIIHIPLISDNPCITCLCENKKVRCVKRACPSNEGCYMVLFHKPKNSCCDVCKGCVYKGNSYRSGEEWSESNNVCVTRSCKAGVITRSKLQCYTPCSHPTYLPGQCCPSCQGCSFEGEARRDGSRFGSLNDPCLQCRCQEGSVTCMKTACPVLNCPPNKIRQEKGACCPTCAGKRKFFDFRSGSCLFRNRVYPPRTTFKPDKCTKCTCDAGTTVCDVENCPLITCPDSDIVHDKGSCCRRCVVKPRRNCSSWERTYQHGEVWKSDACTGCSCNDGVLRCKVKDCSHMRKCPRGYELKYEQGVCCPKCVEVEATCSVFGDPHYTTFDGKVYNYQGRCKYLLASDCVGRTFSVRVRNSARRTKLYAWTQVVIIDIDNTKINLLRYRGVKVNKRYVNVPYSDNRLFSVFRQGYSVVVKLNIGVVVRWDGDSYLEVTVSSRYKSRMCGLCGNYNGDESDDFTGKSGVMFKNATDFGDSWEIGSAAACKRRQKAVDEAKTVCEGNLFSRYRAERRCGVFRDPALMPCMRAVKAGSFIRSCITDSCDCPAHKACHCEAIRAFARACSRAGVPVELTGALQKCEAPVCPRGARYSTCGPACVKTCEDHLSKKPFTCSKPCVEGCHCPSHRVWFNNRCVKPTRCEKLVLRKRRREQRKTVGKSHSATSRPEVTDGSNFTNKPRRANRLVGLKKDNSLSTSKTMRRNHRKRVKSERKSIANEIEELNSKLTEKTRSHIARQSVARGKDVDARRVKKPGKSAKKGAYRHMKVKKQRRIRPQGKGNSLLDLVRRINKEKRTRLRARRKKHRLRTIKNTNRKENRVQS